MNPLFIISCLIIDLILEYKQKYVFNILIITSKGIIFSARVTFFLKWVIFVPLNPAWNFRFFLWKHLVLTLCCLANQLYKKLFKLSMNQGLQNLRNLKQLYLNWCCVHNCYFESRYWNNINYAFNGLNLSLLLI